MLPALAPLPLRDRIRGLLRQELLEGRLAPGEQIRLAPLAKRLAVSMTPAREALTQLEAEGWVVLHPNRGFFAAPVTLEEAEAIYPILATLEGLAIELQESLTAARRHQLRGLNRRMAAAPRPEIALDCDRQWHEALVADCPNPLLRTHLASLRQRAERYERAYMRHSGTLRCSTDDHERIVQALETDVQQVPALLRQHWDLSCQFIRRWLRDMPADKR